MPKRDLQDSVVRKVSGLAKSLKVIRADIKKISNYERTLVTSILDQCSLYEITNDDLSNFSVEYKVEKKSIPLKRILEVFPNTDIKTILENIVAKVDIDVEKTEENLRFSGEFQDPIIKNIMKQLNKASEETIKVVELK